MENYLVAGGHPSKVGYIGFTKKSANEARTRVMQKFGFSEEELPYFRTLHSLAFRQTGTRREQMFQFSHLRELGNILGIEFKGRSMDLDSHMYGMGMGDRMLHMEGLSRSRSIPLAQVYDETNDPDISWWELEHFARGYAAYKKQQMLIDFTDLLSRFIAQPLAPQLDLLLIDEQQDFSLLQGDVARILQAGAKAMYIAGDDDQAVFQWSGADVNQFLDWPADVQVLDQSHRVPAAIHDLADNISARISRRQPKTWKPKPGAPGSIDWYGDPEEVNMEIGSWLLLARNGYQLAELENLCERSGFAFSSVGRSPLDASSLKAVLLWEKLRKGESLHPPDILQVASFLTRGSLSAAGRLKLKAAPASIRLTASDLTEHYGLGFPGDLPPWFDALDRIPAAEAEYYRAARRRGETLTKKPRIEISTIHASKGGEADHVMLLTDMSTRSYETLQRDPDSEYRVQYVAVTRAKSQLHLIAPKTLNFFSL